MEYAEPTKEEVLRELGYIHSCVSDIRFRMKDGDTSLRFARYENILEHLKTLEKLEGVDNFIDLMLNSKTIEDMIYLVTTPNTEISSLFISILTDLCEAENGIDRVKRCGLLMDAIESCVPLDEANIQTDAQFLNNTLSLISTILDGCENAPDFAERLMNETALLKVIERQFIRDDFDENVYAGTELLSILLQFQPGCIQMLDSSLLNLLLRFCANERNPQSASENEAAHNAFNAVILCAVDPHGNRKLVELRGIEMLLSVWSPSNATMPLAVKAIEAAVSASPDCCSQFVEGGGLKRLFTALKSAVGSDMCFSLVAIVDALLTMLPVNESAFKRVLRKFCENEGEKISQFFDLCIYIADMQDDEEEEEEEEESQAFSTLTLCCSIIAILFAYCPGDIRVILYKLVMESDTLDLETIIDTVELRLDDAPTLVRVGSALEVLKKLKESTS